MNFNEKIFQLDQELPPYPDFVPGIRRRQTRGETKPE